MKRIVGVCMGWIKPDFHLVKAAGIDWVRLGFSFPFKDKLHGEYSQEFLEQVEYAKSVAAQGMNILGGTPCPGVIMYDKKDNKIDWRLLIPEWAGAIDSDTYYDVLQEGSAEIARLTKGFVQYFQVANEMDIDVFHGPLTIEQSIRFVQSEALGLRKGNPDCKPGINPASVNDYSRRMYKELYSPANTPFAYAGIDGYFGSWIPGEPQDWVPWLDEIHDITKQPVLVNEWGYSSIGGAPEAGIYSRTVCETQQWNNVWKVSHTPQEQAEYIRIGLKIFGTYPDCLGSFIFDWHDDPFCYHCGRSECPSECGWGIVDIDGRPKPAYCAVKETVAAYY